MKKYISRYKFLFFVSMLATAAVDILISISAVYEQRMIDAITAGARDAIRHSAVIFIAYSAFSASTYIVSGILQAKVLVRITNAMRWDIVRGSLSQDELVFKEKSTTDYISCLTNDIYQVRTRFINMLYMTVFSGVAIIAAIGIIAYYNLALAGIALISALAITFLPLALGKIMEKKETKKSEKLAEFMSLTRDVFEGFSVISSFGVNHIFKKRMKDNLKIVENAELGSERWSEVTNGIAQLLSATIQALILVYAGSLVMKGLMSMGAFFVFSTLNTTMCSSMTMLLRSIPLMLSVKPILSKINEYSAAQEEDDKEAVTFEDAIEVKQLTFGYSDDQKLFDGKNMTFGKGKKYAVIGKSGSGKTTLINLIRGEQQGYTGSILYDGKDIRKCSAGSIKATLAYVQQNTYIFEDTIKNNICLYEDIPEEDYKNSIKNAGLEKFIASLEDKDEYRLTEGGANISGGQRQRIALARALARKRGFIILDEGTSALDKTTAEAVENMLLSIPDLTLLEITHHLKDDGRYDAVYEI